MTFYSPTLKKGKIRVVDETMKIRNIFCLKTIDSQITKKNELPRILTLTWELPKKIPL